MSLQEMINAAEKYRQEQIKVPKKTSTSSPQKTRFNSRPYER